MRAFLGRLRDSFDESGLLQKELARIASVSAPKVNRLLKGKGDPRLSEAISLSQALGIPFCDMADPTAELPAPRITPYDTNPAYREMIDNLEELTDHDRSKVADFVRWLSASLAEHGTREEKRERDHAKDGNSQYNSGPKPQENDAFRPVAGLGGAPKAGEPKNAPDRAAARASRTTAPASKKENR